jgi:hypothetical protein
MNRIFSILFCMLLWSTTAFAGELSVRDSANWIPTNDVAQLQSDSKDWPFDVNILIENVSNLSALENDARGLVNKSSTMVIAIDPTHRKTVVRFGASTGVQASDYNAISAAGNSDFKLNFIRQGLDAIVAKAVSSRNPNPETATAGATSEKSGIGMWVFIMAGVLFGGILILWLTRKRTKDSVQSEPLSTFDDSMYQRQSSRMNRVAPVAPVVPQNVVVNQSTGNNDLLTGILVGEVLSNQNRTEVIHESAVPVPEPSSSSDSGGSSSSWDSGSSSSSSDSSSSYDSGGSSSSWDSGSSGGGFDSGGGSSGW